MKIHVRLGGENEFLVPFPPKPAGMWRSTYERLSAEADEAHTVASAGLQKILDMTKRQFG